MMALSRSKMMVVGTIVVALVTLAGFGAYTVLGQPPALPGPGPGEDPVPAGQGNEPPVPPVGGPVLTPADAPAAPPKTPKELLEKRLESARQVYQQDLTRIRAGQGLPSELFGWSERWLDAELELVEKPADRVKTLRDHLDRTRDVESLMVGFAKTGQGRQADAHAATYYRVEAEIRLLKQGVEPHPAKDEKGKPEKK